MSEALLSARCPGCGLASDRIPAHFAGRTLRCTRCSATFTVPATRPAPAPTAFDAAPASAPRVPAPTAFTAPEAAPAGPGPRPAPRPTLADDEARTVGPAGPAPGAGPAGVDWSPGEVVLDLYEVLGVLGQGGMGRVYRVRHRGWDVDLAVKAPLPAVLQAVGGAEAFETEAETWVNLGLHPHVVSCYYVRRVDGVPRVFAEFVDGGSLAEAIRRRRLATLDRLLDVAIQFAWGLHYAHEQGLVHRDVKPGNVMLTTDGVAKVTDFGLARAPQGAAFDPSALAGRDTGQSLLVAGGAGGTPAYMSPEQSAGRPLTRRTDLWSWALSVLEMFVGERTWDYGVAAGAVLRDFLDQGGKAVGLPALPPEVADLLARCFHEDPDQRPHTLWDVAAALYAPYEAATGLPYPRAEPRAGGETADSLNNRAASLLDLGQGPEADALWERARRVDPHHLEASANEAARAWARGAIADDELLSRLDEVRKSHPGSARAAEIAGRVRLALGDRAGATRELAAAAAAAPTPELQRELAAAAVPAADTVRQLRGLVQPTVALAGAGEVLAASDGTSLRSWRTDGTPLRTLHSREAQVRALALRADGSLLVAAQEQNLQLLDAAGRPARTFARHQGQLTALAFTPDGNLALAGGTDRTVRVYDVASGRLLRTLEGHAQGIHCLAVDPTGTRVAAGDIEGVVRVFDLAGGESQLALAAHKGRVGALLFADGALFSGGEDRLVREWSARGELVRTLAGHTQAVTALAFSGGQLLSASLDRGVRAWHGPQRALHAVLRLDAPVAALCAGSAPGEVWAAHGPDLSLLRVPHRPRLPALALARPVSAVEAEQRDSLFQVKVDEAQRTLQKGDLTRALELARTARSVPGYERAETAVALWDEVVSRLPRKGLQGAWEVAALEGHADPVLAVALSPDGARVLSGDLRGSLRLWDVASHAALAELRGHGEAVAAVAFTPDGRRGLSGSRDRTARLWDLAAGSSLRVLEGHGEYVAAVAVSPDGALAATGGFDHTVRLWDVDMSLDAAVLEGHEGNVSAVAFGPDGRFVVSGGWDARLRAWDVETRSCVLTLAGHEDNVTALAVSPTGRQVASGGADHTVRLWDLRTRRALRVLAEHTAEVTSVAFSADGRWIFSASRDKTVRVWDAGTGRCARTLSLSAGVLGLALSASGTTLATAGADCVVRLWHLDWEPDPRPLPPWDEKARPYLETFVSLRLHGYTAHGHAPAAGFSEREVDALVDDLHRRGFGGLSREQVAGQLKTLTAAAGGPSFWDEVRKVGGRPVGPSPALKTLARVPYRKVAAGLAVAAALVLAWFTWFGRPPRLRLVEVMQERARDPGYLLDLKGFDCGEGDFAHYLELSRAPEVSAVTLSCLAREPSAQAAEAYLQDLDLTDPDPERAQRRVHNAVSLLAALGDPAVDTLCAHLADPREEVRAAVGRALGQEASMPPPAPPAASHAAECLVSAGQGSDPRARLAAAQELRRLLAGDQVSAVRALALVDGLLKDGEGAVRERAVDVLPFFNPETGTPRARAALGDPDPAVRAAAQRSLSAIDDVRRWEELNPPKRR